MKADFSGYATRNGMKCSDGRTIMADAFKHNDSTRVPLVWQHLHNSPDNILGHAILENRKDGVYSYAFFNGSPAAQAAKEAVQHGDVTRLSIYANNLSHQGKNVVHGDIKEVSLVLAGANPGAYIDNVNIAHSDGHVESTDDEAIIYTGLKLEHQDLEGEPMANSTQKTNQEVFDTMSDEQQALVHSMLSQALMHAEGEDPDLSDEDEGDDEGPTVKEVFDSLTEEQKNVVYFMIGEAVEAAEKEAGGSSEDSSEDPAVQHSAIPDNLKGLVMTRNVFDQNVAVAPQRQHLSHSQIETIVTDAKRLGSYKESVLAHADEYGITNIDLLFPDAKALSNTPELLARQAEWVQMVLNAAKHSPMAKIKTLVADITADEARAKGYVKGSMKKEEVISLLKRTTGPTTVYKKQKLDRDDIIDITDFDVIAWLKWEIRFMLNEELARAILIGDGRTAGNADKVKDPAGAIDGVGIRSIANDSDMYAHKVDLAANVSAANIIDEVTRARTYYRGSGSPTWYTTDKNIIDLLLLKDKMGRRLYATEEELAAALRVKAIVPVEVMEETPNILGIMVNLSDYTLGANKGGEISFFEDFDIDFNQEKYLMETRCSGALTKPKSAIVVRREQGTEVTPSAPSFNGSTNTVTIPTVTGVLYMIDGEVKTGSVVITADVEVEATPDDGYYFPAGATTSWAFTYTEI